MMGNGELEKAKIETVGSTDVHVVGPEAFFAAVVGQLVDADEQRVGPGSDLKTIAEMVAMSMGQYYEVGADLIRGYRGGGVVIQKRIYQQNQTRMSSRAGWRPSARRRW